MTRDEIIKGIDKDLLNKQRRALLDTITFLEDGDDFVYIDEEGNTKEVEMDVIYPDREEHADLFNGLLNLLDLIQDNIEFKLG